MKKPKPYTDNEGFNKFALALKIYPGVKRGARTEFDYFRKTHKDWQVVLDLLEPAIIKLKKVYAWLKGSNRFCPPYKNFKTWTYNRCWEEEFSEYDDYIARSTPQKRTRTAQDAKSGANPTQTTPLRYISPNESVDSFMKRSERHREWQKQQELLKSKAGKK